MSSKDKRIKATRADKEWCAERAGELLLADARIRKAFRSQLIDELLERHCLEGTTANRQKLESAYKTAIPGYQVFSARYQAFYDRGKAKNSTEDLLKLLGNLAIDEILSLYQVKQSIAAAFIDVDFSSVDTNGKITHLDPKLLDIFKVFCCL